MQNYSSRPWVILFGGAGREAVIEKMVHTGLKITKVVVPKRQSEKLKSSIAVIKKLSLTVEEVDKFTLRGSLDSTVDSQLLSIGFPFIIESEIFERHPLALNIHPTLLPKYRGPTSGAYILINRESYAGSTVHLLIEDVDQGAIVAQSKVALTPFDTLRSMQRKVYDTEPSLIIDAIKRLDRGDCLIEQDEAKASIYPRVRKPIDSIIDPTKSLIDLVDEIRACDPEDFPAYFVHHGEKVCIRLWRPEKPLDEGDLI